MINYLDYSPEDFLADESFTNYLLNKETLEIAFWQNWIEQHPHCTAVNEAISLFFVLKEASAQAVKQDASANYAKLASMLSATDISGEQLFSSPSPASKLTISFKRRLWFATSAAAALILGLGAWWYAQTLTYNTAHFSTIAQTAAEAKTVRLPDGSVVQLNSNSSISLADGYNDKKREIKLEGAAFFKVAKDASRPFTVISGSIRTTALGTAFYVYNLRKDYTSVSLLEGRVRVKGNQNSLELEPGEKMLFIDNKPITKSRFNTQQLEDFVKGKISFNDASLTQIKNVLEEYFNVTVEIKGAAPAINFTGKFDASDISAILKALEFSYNIHYNIQAQKVTLFF